MNRNRSTSVRLYWPRYRLFPYEKGFAIKEVKALTQCPRLSENDLFVELDAGHALERLKELTYFAFVETNGDRIETAQHALETYCSIQNGNTKQSTRYSVHGIHEYKGKFNPQVVGFLLNYLGIKEGQRVLDPFCGSGTTLLECLHRGMGAIGFDINPFAVYLSNAKVNAFHTPASSLREMLGNVEKTYLKTRGSPHARNGDGAREAYLAAWFNAKILGEIEILRACIAEECGNKADIFLVLLSNLLRDYSEQEPADLRVRKRRTPLPSTPIAHQFFKNAANLILQKTNLDKALPRRQRLQTRAILVDTSDAATAAKAMPTGMAIQGIMTSPPYATALPYIDTQRLSIVWLDLAPPTSINRLESSLIGTREFEGSQRSAWDGGFNENAGDLPSELYAYCGQLSESVGKSDGFRRRAVPVNIYRYLVTMQSSFRTLASMVNAGTKYALIVGHNHTTLGGRRFDIDTPRLLAELSQHCGWKNTETVPLQTYKRYGLHQKNAVAREDLVVLERT